MRSNSDPLSCAASAPKGHDDAFHRFSARVAAGVGSSFSFILALGVVVVWAITGPLFRFSDTWQLVINTGTTIVTFLMVFLIQNTQNRDARAMHLKVDELIRATKKARNLFLDLDTLSNVELDELEHEFRAHRLNRMPHEDLKKRAIVSTPAPSSITPRKAG
ncbi:MAG: low affinity iron permease family protein [Polyangiaceae bacterium]